MKITKEILKEWRACEDGCKRFNELIPNGATLEVASRKLIEDERPYWANWLWGNCKEDKRFEEQTYLTGDDYCILIGGELSSLIGGGESTLVSRNWSTLVGGEHSTLVGGYGSVFTGGCGSFFHSVYDDGETCSPVCGVVDNIAIKANTPYTLNEKGEWVVVVGEKI